MHTLLQDFNSHAHVERDDYDGNFYFDDTDFNSHAHVERDGVLSQAGRVCADFNSHAHVERDNTIPAINITPVISTHTLTWSVTDSSLIAKYGVIFQLTRSRGA